MRTFFLAFAFVWAVLSLSCSMQCEQPDDIQLTFLVDISDERLLDAAKHDLHQNLGGFMQKLGIATLNDCQRLTVNIAPLSARDELRLASSSLSLLDRGLSARERRERANPKPVIDMINQALLNYDSLKNHPEYAKGSSIGNQILKAISQTSGSGKSYVVVFSDMVQHDEYMSFYQDIPKDVTTHGMAKLFDPVMLEGLSGQTGDVEVIIIHLQQVDTSMKGRRREIAALWSEALEEGLGLKVALVDNLTL